MTPDKIAREKRRQMRLEKLGTNNPICGVCGEADPRCLERHHVAQHEHDPITVVVCRNCHRKVSDDQRDHPTSVAEADLLLQSIGHFMLGLADLLEDIIEKLHEFGRALIDRAKQSRQLVDGGVE